jgi:FkbM family methyltransferase
MSSEALDAVVRSVFLKVGIAARKANLNTLEGLRMATLLNENNVETVLDVGANKGQFGSELVDNDYRGQVVSFEPLPDAHQKLAAAAARAQAKGKSWIVAQPVAVGAVAKQTQFHIAKNSISSSLLPMQELHVNAAPDSQFVRDITVNVRPLHDLVAALGIDSNRLFLKIDTQGTESDVIEGAMPIMDRIVGIKTELSLVELYSGQNLYHKMDTLLRGMGFVLWDVIPVFRNLTTGRLLQFDGVYFR